MQFRETIIKGCFEIKPEIFKDNRGGFFRVFCKDKFKDTLGEEIVFTQINHSINTKKGTFRGMHYQEQPYLDAKLVKCVAGSVLDIFIDIREGSPTFLQHKTLVLTANSKNMVYLCKGIAHGFLTLEDNTELNYYHTECYVPGADKGFNYKDPLLNLKLPLQVQNISQKDANYEMLNKEYKGIKI